MKACVTQEAAGHKVRIPYFSSISNPTKPARATIGPPAKRHFQMALRLWADSCLLFTLTGYYLSHCVKVFYHQTMSISVRFATETSFP